MLRIVSGLDSELMPGRKTVTHNSKHISNIDQHNFYTTYDSFTGKTGKDAQQLRRYVSPDPHILYPA